MNFHAIREAIDNARAWLGRLSQREQALVLGGAAVAVLLFMLSLGLWISTSIHRAEHRVSVKTQQLTELLTLQGEYKLRERERAAKLRQLGRQKVRLVSLIEDVARQAGVEIGQLRPEDSEPTAEGIVESRVDLRAGNLSADRLQKFLNLLKEAPGMVIVRRLKLARPYRKETIDIEMSVITYKVKS